jgi:phosphoglycolate phosphatase-like HAD superfamily hydrolase
MAIALRPPGALRAVLFDLDDALLDRAPAWRYALEEAVISVTGRRIDATPLVGEYLSRPWRHVLRVVLADPREIERCAELCPQMFYRSAMKRLLVHEGLGMALDHLRGARMDMGAISHEPHGNAIKQIQSTGLDRFLTVLSATPAGAPWDPTARLDECLGFIERPADVCAFVSADEGDGAAAAAMGMAWYRPGWASETENAGPLVVPGDLAKLVV